MFVIRETLSKGLSRVALWLVQLANWISPGFYEISVEAINENEETPGSAGLGTG